VLLLVASTDEFEEPALFDPFPNCIMVGGRLGLSSHTSSSPYLEFISGRPPDLQTARLHGSLLSNHAALL
jgi:hypothetical protein